MTENVSEDPQRGSFIMIGSRSIPEDKGEKKWERVLAYCY